jgi:hypothetical protein
MHYSEYEVDDSFPIQIVDGLKIQVMRRIPMPGPDGFDENNHKPPYLVCVNNDDFYKCNDEVDAKYCQKELIEEVRRDPEQYKSVNKTTMGMDTYVIEYLDETGMPRVHEEPGQNEQMAIRNARKYVIGNKRILRVEQKSMKTLTVVAKRYKSEAIPESGDDDNRTLTYVLTSTRVDRDNESVNPEGGNFDEYKLNPTVQWNHDTDDFPIGKLVAWWNEEIGPGTKYPQMGGERRMALLGKVQFSQENPKGDQAYRMAKEGTLGGGSISFVPLGDVGRNDQGGNHYNNWKLLEFTICSVGSNPDSIVLKRALMGKATPPSSWNYKIGQEVKGSLYGDYAGKTGVVTGRSIGLVTVEWSDGSKSTVNPAYIEPIEGLKSMNSVRKSQAVDEALQRLLVTPHGNHMNARQVESWATDEWFNQSSARREFKDRKQFASAVKDAWEQRGKSMKRKLFVKGNKAILLKSEGPVSDDTEEYLKQRGLDDIQVQSEEPHVEMGYDEEIIGPEVDKVQGLLWRGVIRIYDEYKDRTVTGKFEIEDGTLIQTDGTFVDPRCYEDLEFDIMKNPKHGRLADGTAEWWEKDMSKNVDEMADDVAKRAKELNEAGAELDRHGQWLSGTPRRGKAEPSAYDLEKRAKEIAAMGAEPEDAVDAAAVEMALDKEEYCPMLKSVKRRLKSKRVNKADENAVYEIEISAKVPGDSGEGEWANYRYHYGDFQKMSGDVLDENSHNGIPSDVYNDIIEKLDDDPKTASGRVRTHPAGMMDPLDCKWVARRWKSLRNGTNRKGFVITDAGGGYWNAADHDWTAKGRIFEATQFNTKEEAEQAARRLPLETGAQGVEVVEMSMKTVNKVNDDTVYDTQSTKKTDWDGDIKALEEAERPALNEDEAAVVEAALKALSEDDYTPALDEVQKDMDSEFDQDDLEKILKDICDDAEMGGEPPVGMSMKTFKRLTKNNPRKKLKNKEVAALETVAAALDDESEDSDVHQLAKALRSIAKNRGKRKVSKGLKTKTDDSQVDSEDDKTSELLSKTLDAIRAVNERTDRLSETLFRASGVRGR